MSVLLLVVVFVFVFDLYFILFFFDRVRDISPFGASFSFCVLCAPKQDGRRGCKHICSNSQIESRRLVPGGQIHIATPRKQDQAIAAFVTSFLCCFVCIAAVVTVLDCAFIAADVL